MTNLKNCVEKQGKNSIILIFILEDLKKLMGKFCICNEDRSQTFIGCIPETTPLESRICVRLKDFFKV